jgi:hypothetical protein
MARTRHVVAGPSRVYPVVLIWLAEFPVSPAAPPRDVDAVIDCPDLAPKEFVVVPDVIPVP